MLAKLWSRIVGTPRPFLAKLRKDCFYVIMMPEDEREEFLKALEALDLSQGPEILVLDEMHLTVMEFSRAAKQTRIFQAGNIK
jgi:hypothetical protein